MAIRSETARRKQEMLADLRRAGATPAGNRAREALSQRELSARYGLSGQTVSSLLKQLVAEGVLYTVPRIGTFLGRPQHPGLEPYLFLSTLQPQFDFFTHQIRDGFLEQTGRLGVPALSLTVQEAESHLQEGELRQCAGVFLYGDPRQVDPGFPGRLKEAVRRIPLVFGCGWQETALAPCATISFDDRAGGREATRHLLENGHRKIAFLGLHSADENAGNYPWSRARASGWQEMMQSAGLPHDKLLYLPATEPDLDVPGQLGIAQQLAPLVLQSEASAVEAANRYMARGLLDTLRGHGIPPQKWPALLSFDQDECGMLRHLSYLRLPWEKIGSAAAQWAFENRLQTGRAEPTGLLVPMQLVPQLTCRPGWAHSSLAQKLLHPVPDAPVSSAANELLVSGPFHPHGN